MLVGVEVVANGFVLGPWEERIAFNDSSSTSVRLPKSNTTESDTALLNEPNQRSKFSKKDDRLGNHLYESRTTFACISRRLTASECRESIHSRKSSYIDTTKSARKKNHALYGFGALSSQQASKNDTALTVDMRDGTTVRFVRGGDRWEAIVVQNAGLLTRVRRLPVRCCRHEDLGTALRRLTSLPPKRRSYRTRLLERSSSTSPGAFVFVGGLELKGGGDENKTDEGESGSQQELKENEADQQPSSSNWIAERVSTEEIVSVVDEMSIVSLEMLVDTFNSSDDAKERSILLECVYHTLMEFDRMSVGFVTMRNGEALREYEHLNRIRLEGQKDAYFRRDYVETLCHKFLADDLRNAFLAYVLRTALKSTEPSSYKDEPQSLIELCCRLASILDPSNTPFTDATFAYEGEALQLLHIALEILGKIAPQSSDANNPSGLLNTFRSWADAVLAAPAYYPVHHYVLLIKQSLRWLISTNPSDVRASNNHALFKLFRGTLVVYQIVRKAVVLDFDTNSTMKSLEELRTSGNIKPGQFYDWHMALNSACLLTLGNPTNYVEFQDLLVRIVQNEKRFSDVEERKAMCYSMVQFLQVLAVQSESADVRFKCLNTVAEYLNMSDKGQGDWSNDPDIVIAVLNALARIACSNEQSEADFARMKIKNFAAQKGKANAVVSAFHGWTRGTAIDDRIKALFSQSIPPSTNILFREVNRKLRAGPSNAHGMPQVVNTLFPPPIVPYFVERGSQLEKSLKDFSVKQTAVIVKCFVGPAGIGKTQLATSVFQQLVQDYKYDYKFWIPASSKESLQESFVNIATSFSIYIDPNANEYTVRRARAHLENCMCLYVFDDAIDEPSILPYFPLKRGHVIVTSRNVNEAHWREPPVLVRPFDVDEAIKLCRAMRFSTSEQFEDEMRAAFEHLPKYPLCLAQFSAASTHIGFSPKVWLDKYLKLQGAEQEKALLEFLESGRSELGNEAHSVISVFKSSLERMCDGTGTLGGRAERLLRRLAYLDPQGVPTSWIISWEPQDDMFDTETRRSLALLEKSALVTWNRTDETVYIHAETQMLMRYVINREDALQHDKGEELIKSAQDYLNISENYASKKRATMALLPHMRAIYKHLISGNDHKNAFYLAEILCEACETVSDYKKSIYWAQTRLTLGRKIYGDRNHEEIASALQLIGRMYRKSGKYDEALEHHNRSHKMRIALHGGRNDPEIAASLNNIGSTYRKLDNYAKALKYHQRSLAMRERVYGKTDHADIATSLNNIGLVLNESGSHNEALQYHMRALAMRRKLFGNAPNQDVAASLNNLGLVLHKLGRHREALENHQQSLKMRQDIFGTEESHPSVVMSCKNIAAVTAAAASVKKVPKRPSLSPAIVRKKK